MNETLGNPGEKTVSVEPGRIKKNTYFIAISQVAQLTLAFFLNWVATRTLGDENFGKYMFASVLSFFVFLCNDLGIVTYVTREVAKHKERVEEFFLNGLMLKILLIGLSCVFLGIYLNVFSFQRDKIITVILFGVFGIFYSFNQLCIAIFRAFERMEYEMIVLVAERVVISALGITLLLRGRGLVSFATAFVLGSAFCMLLSFSLIKKKFLHKPARLKWVFMKRLLSASFMVGIFWIITNIHERVDILMLEAMKSDAMVGWYTLAYKLILIAGVIPMILMTSTFPRISRDTGENEGTVNAIYRVGFKYLFFIALPMVVGTLFLADKIVLFFGEDFGKAGVALRILIFAAGVDFFSIFFAGFLIAWNRQRDLTLLQGVALLLNIAVNAVLIPFYGYIGASVSTVLSRSLIFIVCFIWVLRRIHRVEIRPLFQGILATLVMALFLAFWEGDLFLTVVLSGMIYGGVLWLMGGIRSEEILVMRKVRM